MGKDTVALFETEPAQLSASNSRSDCIGPPLRAGISTNFGCTTGFMAREDGVNRFMTAGTARTLEVLGTTKVATSAPCVR